MITLYHAPRSRSFRALWLLEEIGVPYDIKSVTIRRGDGSGARDPANPHPHGKVPAIQHDGATIFESAAIALYLTDTFPEAKLAPRVGEANRAAYVTWLAYYGGVFEPSLTAKFLKIPHIYGTFGWGPWEEVLDHLTRTLEAQPYFLGQEFSAVDVIYGGSLPILMKGGLIPDSVTFTDYAARVSARPAFARASAKDAV